MVPKISVWSIVMWLGIAAIALAQVPDITYYGIPAAWLPYVRLIAFLAALAGAKQSLGYRFTGGSSGAGKIAPVVLLALILPLSMSVSGCAWFQKEPTLTAQQAAYQQVKKAADVIDAAGKVAATAQQTEIALYHAGAISEPTHRGIQLGFKLMAQQVEQGLLVLRDLTKTPMEQQAAITQIETSMKTFVDSLASLPNETKAQIKALMDGALLMVQGALLMT